LPTQSPVPGSIPLELATLVNVPPTGDEWLAEAKYDGYRLVLTLEDGQVRALTRSGADWTDRFSGLAAAVAQLPASSAVLDGEAVVFDDAGVSRFEQLQTALGSHPERISFAAFDLLHLNGFDLRDQPLVARKELLATLLAEPPAPLRYADHIVGGGPELYATACSAGLEGVVCKRADSRYVAGRGRDWQKVKCRHTQELVVGGFTEGQGSRGELGSLLVGYHEGARLVYAGRVGSGFDERTLAELTALLRAAERPDSPFDPAPTISGHEIHWAEPHLVIEAAFREWTKDGVLRQPVFLGVREDKPAEEVVREAALDRSDFGQPESIAGVRVTNPQKLLFPESDFEKRALAEYYEAIAPAMLPHVANRPLTLLRCPIGHGRSCFYQRHPDAGLPRDVHTLGHTLTGHAEEDLLLWVDSAAGLVSLAQMGVLEIHTWLSGTDMPTRPDRIIFDLDPGPGLTWPRIAEGARIVREEFSALGFTSFLKSTGSKGLHVVVPIEASWEFVGVRSLCKAITDTIVAHHPELFVGKAAKDIRTERIFLDYLRNSEGASAVAPYSTRNLSGPSVAVPLAWDELTDDLDIRSMTPQRVLERVGSGIDPWESIGRVYAKSSTLRAAASAMS
jgi:bifunctional non-homologous end joining protein LigD